MKENILADWDFAESVDTNSPIVWSATPSGKLKTRIYGKIFAWRSFNRTRQQLLVRCCHAKCYRLCKIKVAQIILGHDE